MRKTAFLIVITIISSPGCCLWHFHSTFPFVELPKRVIRSPDLDNRPNADVVADLDPLACRNKDGCSLPTAECRAGV
jgi:hypothetical protein